MTHSHKEYVRGNVRTNTIEGFFSIFKRGMRGAEDAATQSAKTIIIAARRQTILGALHTAIEAHYQRPGAANAAKPMYGQPPDRDWLAEELADEDWAKEEMQT